MSLEIFDKDAIDNDPRPHEEVDVRLPKQWMHWAKSAGLKTTVPGRFRGFYLKGRGRNWRVNCYGFFEASCPIPHFDRWANSRGSEVRQLPRSHAEFLDVVRRMVAASASAS